MLLFISSYADTAAAFNPDLIVLQLRRQADGVDADSVPPPRMRKIVADSARIISPKIHSAITADTAVYEIKPLMHVDSVMLFVRHSQNLADTLGVFTSPPFRAVWNNFGISAQDQIHLQFGYVLYSGDSLAVVSPTMPHRWALKRKTPPSDKRYTIKQLADADDFNIDGDLFKWREVKGAHIADIAYFRLLWTSTKLYFVIEVQDSSVTSGDFVELHLDMHRDRSNFSGINHRSLRFGPRARSRSFVVELTDSGFIYSDSVNTLLSEETEWATVVKPDGYVIEAAIPFTVLSNIGYPPSKIGFDVSVMNIDRVKTSAGNIEETASFYSWSGAERFARYSPRSWGTAKMNRAIFAVKIIFFAVIIFALLAPIFFVITLFASKHNRHDSGELDNNSQIMDAIIECIDDGCTNANFGLSDLLKSVDAPEDVIISEIKRSLDCTFDQLLIFRRIKLSQKLMKDPDNTIDKIAEMCGFADVDAYTAQYKMRMKVEPEVSRRALLDKIREEAEERARDEDDD